MSKKSDVDFEGDHVECTKCTCVSLEVVNEETKNIVQSRLHQSNLENWEKWISKRKHVHNRLSKHLNRPAGDLLMNLDDQNRQIQEERIVYEYCKINTDFDKYRGNPAFWKLPPGLADKIDRHFNPTYFTTKTKIECNEIPVIEHVATPNYVLNEKDILPNTRNLYTARQGSKSQYIKKISDNLKKVYPYQPECSELIIVGEKLIPKDEDSNSAQILLQIPEDKSVSEHKESLSESPSLLIPTRPKIYFVVNRHHLSSCNEFGSNEAKIDLRFEYVMNSKTPAVKYLKFENKGLTTMRFYWNQLNPFFLFRDIIEKHREEETKPFYFNKNELILPPDEKIDFPILFKSDTMGTYSEMWEITTKPLIGDGDNKLIVTLVGYVFPDGFEKKAKGVKQMLDEKVGDTQVRDVLNDIIYELKFEDTELGIFTVTEKELFESANLNVVGMEIRPKYLYKESVVNLLKSLYNTVKLPYSNESWNYSVRVLRSTAREKDIWVYAENKTKEMLKAKQRRAELLNKIQNKNLDEKISVLDSQSRIVEEETEHYSRQIDRIVQDLERPSMIPNTERLKYFTAYAVIRTYLFLMCDTLEQQDNTYTVCDVCYPSYDYKRVSAIEQTPERLLFETFDYIWVNRMKRNSPQGKLDSIAQPKPGVLDGIPMEDSELVYNTYFLKYKSGQTGGGRDEEVRTLNKVDQASINQEIKLSRIQSVKGDFDPFQEKYIPLCPISPVASAVHCDKDEAITCDYYKYLIVYNYLTEAVEAMVDAVETMKEKLADIEAVGEVLQCSEELNRTDEFEMRLHITSPEASEEGIYFQSVLDMHLKNQHTHEFLIADKVRYSSSEDSRGAYKKSSVASSATKSSCTIVELSLRAKVSAEAQTSDVNYSIKQSSSSLLPKYEPNVVESQSNNEEKLSQGIFYFMKDDAELVKEK